MGAGNGHPIRDTATVYSEYNLGLHVCERANPYFILPPHPKYHKKYNPGSPKIDDVIENVFVFLYICKYKTRKQKYIVSGFEFPVLYF